MNKRITVTKENRAFIAKAFGVTERMVFKALAFQSDTDLAKRIRTLATKRGGYIISAENDFETFHDHDDYMRQYFPNGAMLEVNKKNGNCDAFVDGECVRRWENIMVSDIKGIQDWISAL
ncbi:MULTISPECIES: hypothetical protein [Bacteroidales]|jgi:hypothetical protein|uniref:hypothetical protein n=1 Tax=Bacteroidales TaxID=171549 RepID=UPI0009306B5C|nr:MULTISPECIES: hypothetical protein [Bacteroidales]DAW97756.1 MAG TPA: hypothetical protein [Bacteriophage sp.]DAY82826.1 MAG TPA: hypothetical protein [Caudoviricetes sp.]